MKFRQVDPPRRFTAGRHEIELRHVAGIVLEPDEVVTFHTDAGAQYDVARKVWGFYATPRT